MKYEWRKCKINCKSPPLGWKSIHGEGKIVVSCLIPPTPGLLRQRLLTKRAHGDHGTVSASIVLEALIGDVDWLVSTPRHRDYFISEEVCSKQSVRVTALFMIGGLDHRRLRMEERDLQPRPKTRIVV